MLFSAPVSSHPPSSFSAHHLPSPTPPDQRHKCPLVCVFISHWSTMSPPECLYRYSPLLMLLLVFTVILPFSSAFNLDPLTALVQRGPHHTNFGFSVSLHKDRNVSWLLVGAPLASTDQPRVERGGAVYRCSVDSINSCQQIAFDRTGPSVIKLEGRDTQEDEKSHQWFGATLHSTAEGPIVACAPRFVYFTTKLNRRDPIGTCWVSRGSFTGFFQYSPCRNFNWGYHRQGSCQAGMSAAVSKDGKRLFVGAPGSWYWQGQAFSHDLEHMTSVQTNKGLQQEDDSFLGYSVTVGHFSNANDYDVAVGMPKGNNYTGKVVIFSSSLHNTFNITNSDKQMGSYFGYSLATVDVNSDGLDDIIIGAPLYSSPVEKDQSYEKGRIYVALQTRDHKFQITANVSGKTSKGRFGLSIANLGDINKDGFEDVAVGAPYDGPHSKGAVYILLGSKNGLISEFSQIIYAEDIADSGLETFGWSLSGGLDMDDNNYNDLLVGAYSSDRAIMLRARPVVNVTSSLTTSKSSINLETRDCTLSDGTRTVCVTVKVCLSFEGIGVDNRLEFHYRTVLDASSTSSPRLFFTHKERENEEELTTTLSKGQQWCKERQAYLIASVRDKLTPINITLDYWLPRVSPVIDSTGHTDSLRLAPVLSGTRPSFLNKLLSISKNCGSDNVCKPDLAVHARLNVDEYVVGSRKKLEMHVTVTNRGEDSYETVYSLRMPYDVNYVRVNKSANHPEVACHGARPDVTGLNELVCDLGNPLKGGKKVDMVVIMEPARVSSASSPDYLFLMNVTSANAEENSTLDNNRYEIGIPLKVEVDLGIYNVSDPAVLSYNSSTLDSSETFAPQTLEDIGKEITHSYTLTNRGPTTIRRAEVSILWPTRDLHGKYLLYLVDQVQVQSRGNKGFCKTITLDDMNPLGLKTLQSRKSSQYQHHRSARAVSHARQTGPPADSADAEMMKKYRELTESCGPVNCTKIECTVQDLEANDTVTFSVKSRFWNKNVLVNLDEYQLSSTLIAMVTALPYDVSRSLLQPQVEQIHTRIYVSGMDRGVDIPWLLILAAILIGLIILAALALALWKWGFFKRKRPPKTRSSDREPLQRKGDASL